MTLRLGFFSDFEGEDTVLLAGSTSDISGLCSTIHGFLLSDESVLAVHELTCVSPSRPAAIYLTKNSDEATTEEGKGFVWACATPEAALAVEEKLIPLATANVGHQYFELANSGAQLMVSAGEYEDEWWKSNA